MVLDIIKEDVLAHEADFMRLLTNFNTLYWSLEHRMSKKVFYSDAERDYYERNMREDLMRNYEELYHKYISAKYPEFREYYYYLHPRRLSEILGQKW